METKEMDRTMGFDHPSPLAPLPVQGRGGPAEQTGCEMIAAERERQVTRHGFHVVHDQSHHQNSELVDAAMVYAAMGGAQAGSKTIPALELTKLWPWGAEWFKPAPEPIRNLVKAGALIAAEIDRLKAQ